MARRANTRKRVVTPGRRVGTKRSDKRWESPDGEMWDSKYEYEVYREFIRSGVAVRRCTKSDTMAFVLPIKRGICGTCGSAKVGQQRHYTPDLLATTSDPQLSPKHYYIETKGYLRAKERSLLRSLYKAYPDASICVILQRDYPIPSRAGGKPSKSSIVKWFNKFLPNYKVTVWDGSVPRLW